MSRTLLRCLALIVTLQVAAGAEVVTDGAGGATRKEPSGGFLDRVYTDETGDHRYVVFVPETPPPSEGWPVILFLHGAGERGVDGRRQLDVGLGPIVKLQQQSFPAVVVFPQCEDTTGPILSAWDADGADGRRALKILELVERDFPVNPQLRAAHRMVNGGVRRVESGEGVPGDVDCCAACQRWRGCLPGRTSEKGSALGRSWS